MSDINKTLDNRYMNEEYLDAEIICDNKDPANCARIAHEIWDEVISNDKDTNDIGDSIWPQVLNVIQDRIQNGLEEEIALEVREIIWENYVPEFENYINYIMNNECPHKCGDCITSPDDCAHGCHDCGYFDGGNCVHSGSVNCGCLDGYCACDCPDWNDGRY